MPIGTGYSASSDYVNLKNGLVTAVNASGTLTLEIDDGELRNVPTLAPVTAGTRVVVAVTRYSVIVLGTTQGTTGPTSPAGDVVWSAADDRAGALLADGSDVSRTTYAALYAAIGTKFGTGNGVSTFTLPNIAGRTVVGRDPGDSDLNTVGDTGGEKQQQLTSEQIPFHTHAVDLETTADTHGHGIGGHGRFMVTNRTGDFGDRASPSGTSGAAYVAAYAGDDSQHVGTQSATETDTHAHAVRGDTLPNIGGGDAHNNMPPYVVLNAFITHGN